MTAGSLSLAQENLRVTLAACAKFQTWVGAASAAAALASIHHDGLPAPADAKKGYTLAELQGYRPFAIVYTQEQGGYSRQIAAVRTYRDGGRLKLRLEQDVPALLAGDIASADVAWKDTIGQIIDQMAALAGVAPYLDIRQITVDDGPYRNHPDTAADQGDAQGIELGITWGTAGQ